MKTIFFLIATLFTFNIFACTDSFNGKYVDENSGSNILEIKVHDCSLFMELDFPAEGRTGHIIADTVNRIIWDKGGRKISEKSSVTEDTLTINIVDKHPLDVYYQNQIYKLTPTGLELYIEIYNTKRTYDYKKRINYLRE